MSQLSERSFRRTTDPDMVEAVDEIVTYWNAGRYTPRLLTAAPTHTGTDGESYVVDVGGTRYLYTWISGSWRYLTYT